MKNEQFLKMQKLAGLITESEFKNKLNENKTYLTPDDFNEFRWKDQPLHPEDMLVDNENDTTYSKREFWESDINGRDIDETIPSYGKKLDDGTWGFSWDTGDVDGFVEGEDFTLGE
jgi:hypothetical protein